jgi:hypothetical protein
MAVSIETKLRWFDQGATAFARTFPDRVAQFPEGSSFYVCPLCIRPDIREGTSKAFLFPRTAVTRGILTAEHVPPESFGGKELLLTCAPCNHTAGAHLDSHARKRENPVDAFQGRVDEPVAVRLTADGHSIAADFIKEGDTFTLKVLPEAKSGKPGSEEGFREVLARPEGSDRDINISFYADRHSERRARVSWLRSAYLALFAVLGYRYVFQAALAVVRRQILDPETDHIPTFLCVLPTNPPWSERRIVLVREPEWQQCWTVQFGRYIVFLPLEGDDGLYERIATARSTGAEQACVSGTAFEWPDRPFFGMA